MLTIGGILFGSVVGYIAWYAIRPGESGSKVTLKTVAAFVGIVAGATVIAFLQSDANFIAAYGIGLAIGFFFPPVSRYFHKYLPAQKNTEKQEAIRQEIQRIDAEWSFFEKFITSKMSISLYRDNALYAGSLRELDFTIEGKAYILKRYAREHSTEGYAIGDTAKQFGKVEPLQGVEHTHLYLDPFFLLDRYVEKKNRAKSQN